VFPVPYPSGATPRAQCLEGLDPRKTASPDSLFPKIQFDTGRVGVVESDHVITDNHQATAAPEQMVNILIGPGGDHFVRLFEVS